MKGHRAAAVHAASQTEARKELGDNRDHVKKLKQMREQLKEDLESQNGNTLQVTKDKNNNIKISLCSVFYFALQKEVDDLKKEISKRRMTKAERSEELKKKFSCYRNI